MCKTWNHFLKVFFLAIVSPLAAQTTEEPFVESDLWVLRSGVQLNIGNKGTSNLRGFISIGRYFEMGSYAQADVSASLNAYLCGLGTHQGVTGRGQLTADLNLAAGLTAGLGTQENLDITIFHDYSGNVVRSTYDASLSAGLIYTLSALGREFPGRNQFNGYTALRVFPVSIGLYNDFFVELLKSRLIEQNDSYWTGGGSLQVDAGFGMFSFHYDAFTGKRPEDRDDVGEIAGQIFYNQPTREQQYNNGVTSIRFSTTDFDVGIMHIGNGTGLDGNGKGINGQWAQNLIHSKLFKLPCFLNTSKQSYQISIAGKWQHEFE